MIGKKMADCINGRWTKGTMNIVRNQMSHVEYSSKMAGTGYSPDRVA